MSGRTLNVALADDLDAEVMAAVAGGEYSSPEEAVADAVATWSISRRLDHSLDREGLRQLWQEGIESGPGRSLSIEKIKDEARNRLAKK